TGEQKPLCDLLGPGSHGTTFGGTPLACAGALEVLSVIEEERLLANARDLGAHARTALQALPSPLIKEVRALGLMLGIELAPDFLPRIEETTPRAPSWFLVDQLHAAGLLAVPSGAQIVRWLPPLNVKREEIDEAVQILGRVLRQLGT
nr:aminotransferase class III-fold pyridoxal phosphate-dependent enzyme [Verrucomicrobiota bacterium]